MNQISDKKISKSMDFIYDQLYKSMQQDIIDIFLCGGVSYKSRRSLRDRIKKELLSLNKFRILYPEDLFMDVINLNKDNNLLALEQLLAQNCDCICIVCESVGSFVELGAFTNNPETFEKVVALVQSKYKNEKSFIILGPIKYIQSKNKDNVVFYNSDLNQTKKHLIAALKNFKSTLTSKDINTIVGLHYFILLILFFFRSISVKVLASCLFDLIILKGFNITKTDFDIIFRAAIKLLYKEKSVESYNENDNKFYQITPKGLLDCEMLISKTTVYKKWLLCDKIRLKIFQHTYY